VCAGDSAGLSWSRWVCEGREVLRGMDKLDNNGFLDKGAALGDDGGVSCDDCG